MLELFICAQPCLTLYVCNVVFCSAS